MPKVLEGRAIIESSSAEGVLFLIEGIKHDFHHVNATEPVTTHDGRYISSVRFSNEKTILQA